MAILANQIGVAEDIKEIRTNEENVKVNESRREGSIKEMNNKTNGLENTMKTLGTFNENRK